MPVRVEGYVALLREIVTVDAIEGVRVEVKKVRHVPATLTEPVLTVLHVPETFTYKFVRVLHVPADLTCAVIL